MQQQTYNQMNPAAAQYGGPGSQGGLMPAQQMTPYDISTSPPQQQLGGGIDTSNDHFQQFS